MTVRNLKFVLSGEDKSASKTIDKVHHKFAGLAAGLAGGALGAGVVEFGKKAVEAAAEGEQAHARLAVAIENSGSQMWAVQPAIDKLTGRFAKLGFTNDEVEAALGTMTTATGSASKALGMMGDAADVARYKHISLADAGTLLAKAQGGSMRAFKELGITVEKGVPKAQALRDAMAQLHARIGGQAAAAAGTYSGKIQAMHAQFQNFQETVGAKVLPVLLKLMNGLQSVAGFVERNQKVIKPLAVAFALIGGTLFTLVKVTKAFTAVMEALDVVLAANPIGLVVIAIAALVAGLILAYKHSATFRKIVQGTFKAIGEAAQAMWNVIRPVLKLIADAYLAFFGALVHGAAAAFGWVPGIGGKLKRAAKEFDSFKDLVNKSLAGINETKTITIQAVSSTTAQKAANAAIHSGAMSGSEAAASVVSRTHTTHVTVPVNLDGKRLTTVTTKVTNIRSSHGHLNPGQV